MLIPLLNTLAIEIKRQGKMGPPCRTRQEEEKKHSIEPFITKEY